MMAVGLPASAADVTNELNQTQTELRDAEAELDRLLTQIDQVEQDVAAADQRIAELQEVLSELRDARAQADHAADAAESELISARGRLRTALTDVDGAQARAQVAREALNNRVAMIWIHGPGESAEVMLDGFLVAESLHDIAVVRHASAAALDADSRLMRDAADAAAEAARLLSLADSDRLLVEETVAQAQAARVDADVLERAQEELVARAANERATRTTALRRIEDDVAARAALIQRLSDRVSQLRAASLDDWLREVQDLPIDGPVPVWASNLPAAGQPLARLLEHAAASAGIDGRLFAALVWTESSFRPGAVSPSGAIGLAQLMPPTAADLGVDPHDPLQNVLGGARYVRQQLDRFGRVDLALAAYNAGPNRVARDGNVIPNIVETQLYVLRILDRWERLG
jgi:soluble lytic murein transglycosylase-like protein